MFILIGICQVKGSKVLVLTGVYICVFLANYILGRLLAIVQYRYEVAPSSRTVIEASVQFWSGMPRKSGSGFQALVTWSIYSDAARGGERRQYYNRLNMILISCLEKKRLHRNIYIDNL